MMRALVLGEYRAERLADPLRQEGAEVIVLGFADLHSCFSSEIAFGKLPVDLTDDSLATLLSAYRADIVIPNVNSPGQEQLLPVYSRIGSSWRANGRNFLVHPEGFAALATDKVVFHQVAQQRSWPVPKGTVCHGPDELMAFLEAISLPVIVKEARSESHAGRHYVQYRRQLQHVSGAVGYPVLVQQVITGQEFAVELLSEPGRTIAWPVASLGSLDRHCAPGKHVRVEPASLPGPAQKMLDAFIDDVISEYRPAGPWQMDLAVSGDELFIIELNGRFGGISNMSWISTAVDPHWAHIQAVFRKPVRQPQPKLVAVEIPVYNQAELPPAPAGLEARSFVGGPTNQVPLKGGYYRAVLAVPEDRAEQARTWLAGLPPEAMLADAEQAVEQLARGIRALSRGEGVVREHAV